jgi:DNA polymerase-3 subunit alpha
MEMLEYEKELLGFYVTGHPLDAYAGHFDSAKYLPIVEVPEMTESGTVKLAGIIRSAENKFSREGKPFCAFVLEDISGGSVELSAWDETATKNAEILKAGSVIAVSARVNRRDDNVRVYVNSVQPLKPRVSRKAVALRFSAPKLTAGDLERVAAAIRKFAGNRPVQLDFVQPDGGSVEVLAGEEFGVGDERGLRGELADLLLPG